MGSTERAKQSWHQCTFAARFRELAPDRLASQGLGRGEEGEATKRGGCQAGRRCVARKAGEAREEGQEGAQGQKGSQGKEGEEGSSNLWQPIHCTCIGQGGSTTRDAARCCSER